MYLLARFNNCNTWSILFHIYISPTYFLSLLCICFGLFQCKFQAMYVSLSTIVCLWKIVGGRIKGPKMDIETVSNGSVKPLLVPWRSNSYWSPEGSIVVQGCSVAQTMVVLQGGNGQVTLRLLSSAFWSVEPTTNGPSRA